LRHNIERLEDKYEKEYSSSSGFWKGANAGSCVDAAAGGWTLGLGTLVGGIIGAAASYAESEDKCKKIQRQIEVQKMKLRELQRQQEEYDFSEGDALGQIEQAMGSEKTEFYASLQDIDADIRLLEGIVHSNMSLFVGDVVKV